MDPIANPELFKSFIYAPTWEWKIKNWVTVETMDPIANPDGANMAKCIHGKKLPIHNWLRWELQPVTCEQDSG